MPLAMSKTSSAEGRSVHLVTSQGLHTQGSSFLALWLIESDPSCPEGVSLICVGSAYAGFALHLER